MELTPQSLIEVNTTNVAPGPIETQLIRAHISLLRNTKYRTDDERATARAEISRLLWLVCGFRQLPVELLTEILQWAVADKRYLLPFSAANQNIALTVSHVCQRWRRVALDSPLRIMIDSDIYARTFPQIQAILPRTTRKNLSILLQQSNLTDSGYAPARSITDVVLSHSQRIKELILFLDVAAIQTFLRLPAGTLAELGTLTLTVGHSTHPDGLLFRPGENPRTTPLSQLAPQLSVFTLTPAHRRDEHCHCTIDPLAIGFDFTKLKTLSLCVGLPARVVHTLLARCIALEKADFVIWRSAAALDEGTTVVQVPALRQLLVRFDGYFGNRNFLEYLDLPALKSFGQASGGDGKGFALDSLLKLLESSHIRLDALYLCNIRPLSQSEMREFLGLQCGVTRLELAGCRGSFWRAMGMDTRSVLVPNLTHLGCIDFPHRHIPLIIAFVRDRCPCARPKSPAHVERKSKEPRALESLRLTPRFPLADHGRPFPVGSRQHSLILAIRHWRECGIEVKVDTSKYTKPRRQAGFKVDGLETPDSSETEGDYGQESDYATEEEYEARWGDRGSETESEASDEEATEEQALEEETEDGPAGSDSSGDDESEVEQEAEYDGDEE